jgi:hypothetical protein
MTTCARIALGLLLSAGCEREAPARRTNSTPSPSATASLRQSPSVEPPSAAAKPVSARTIAEGTPTPVPNVEETMVGNFRGKNRPSRVLFLDNAAVVHAWDENGTERREPITTEPPPGHRECKVLRSRASQDFLLCLYWFTGPGGGRVDGVVFDLKRRIRGEFFSAAINIQLLSTLCDPETMVGPMPSFNVNGWSVTAATDQGDAEVLVKVGRRGWSTEEAAAVRALPATKTFCQCVGSDDCPGAPNPPESDLMIAYRLTDDRLQPAEEARKTLAEISAQWGHSALLKSWNMKMRGF